MRPSRRLEQIPPYLFAELERKVRAKRAAGIDVISLGIGDPDTPTYPPIVAAALCVEPRGLLTDNQVVKVDKLKSELNELSQLTKLLYIIISFRICNATTRYNIYIIRH